MNLNWRKLPEVMTGGKHYFFNAELGDGTRVTVIWDREQKAWAAETSTLEGPSVYGFFSTSRAAKTYIEKHIAREV